jgi:hypothetical protein
VRIGNTAKSSSRIAFRLVYGMAAHALIILILFETNALIILRSRSIEKSADWKPDSDPSELHAYKV